VHMATFTHGGKFSSASGLALVTQNILSAYPDLNDIYAASRGGEGAGEAVPAANLQGKVRVVSFDASDLLIADVKNGTVDVLAVQKPFKMDYHSLKAMVEHIRNGTKSSNEDTVSRSLAGRTLTIPQRRPFSIRAARMLPFDLMGRLTSGQ
jgi:ABC-type sugar transport system substrate-binding protein